jgi:hypothetical protein
MSSEEDNEKRKTDDGLGNNSDNKVQRVGAKRRRREEQTSINLPTMNDDVPGKQDVGGKESSAIDADRTLGSPMVLGIPSPSFADKKRKDAGTVGTSGEESALANADAPLVSNELSSILLALAATNSSVQQLPQRQTDHSSRQEPEADSFSVTNLHQQSGTVLRLGTGQHTSASFPVLSSVASTEHQQSSPFFNPPVGLPGSNAILENPLAMLARLVASLTGTHLPSAMVSQQQQTEPQSNRHETYQLSQTPNEAIPLAIASLLNPNHDNQQPAAIQEMLRQSAQSALQSGQPPSLHSFPPSAPMMHQPSMMGPPFIQQQAQFYHQAPTQDQQNPVNNTHLLSVLTSLLSTQLQGQQHHHQAPPPPPQVTVVNALTNLIISSFSQQQQEQQARAAALNSMFYAPPSAVAAAASMPQQQGQQQQQQQQALHPNLEALLHNFCTSTAAAATANSDPNGSPLGAGAATADPVSSSHTNNDGTISSNPDGPDMAMELSGRPPVVMYIPDVDERSLSEYQCLVRKQIELFEATHEDAVCQVRFSNTYTAMDGSIRDASHFRSAPLIFRRHKEETSPSFSVK